MSRELPERPVNIAVLMREGFAILNGVVLRELSSRGHEAVRTAHGAVFQFVDPSGTTVSTLAERASVTKQAMADLVAHLEKHGYVTRVPDPTDRRAKLVVVTDLGREVLDIAQATVPAIEARVGELIGERRLRELRSDLEAIVNETW